MDQEKKKGIIKISVFITSIFVIFLSVTYAFINVTLTGTKRQVITAGNVSSVLEEDENNLTIENALPMYDEVGMVQKNPFTFRLVNNGTSSMNYTIKLVDITTGSNKLLTSDVKYYLTKEGSGTPALLSSLSDGVIDSGTISGEQTINYTLRLWIRDGVTDNKAISGKSLSYRIDVDASQDTSYPLLSAIAKQGDYIAYEGNNGCMKDGTPVIGDDDAESGNSCLGYNANDTLDTTGDTYGYCYNSAYKFSAKGWRIAYTEDDRAYLVSAGSPECNTRIFSTGNATYISEANEKAKKYCNASFVDGDCSDNSDVWAINDTDFYKMTSQATGEEGKHLTSYYGNLHCNRIYFDPACGYDNDLIDNGGYYWFAAVYNVSSLYGVYWDPSSRVINYSNEEGGCGLRPIIRLSSSVYVTGGSGTMDDPYTIANEK